jgi:hypothetical protein
MFWDVWSARAERSRLPCARHGQHDDVDEKRKVLIDFGRKLLLLLQLVQQSNTSDEAPLARAILGL